MIPRSGRSPGKGNGNPLQYSCLGKSHGPRSLVGYSPWGHKELDTTERLHFTFFSSPVQNCITGVLLHFALLYFIDLANFINTEALWQTLHEQVYWGHFSNSICSLPLSMSHFCNSQNIQTFSLLLYLLWCPEISGL